jgi:O-antigen/teichoic acid export membrane protein
VPDLSTLIHKARTGTLWHGSSQVALTLAGYIVAVILARGLGPVAFGVYGLIYSFLMAVELVTLLGIPGAVSRLTAEGQDRNGSLRVTGLALICTLCGVACAILWAIAPALAVWLGVPDSSLLIRIAVLDVPCFGSYFLIAHILNGRRDFVGQSIGTMLYALTKVIGTAALALTTLTIAGALIVNILSSLVGLAFVLYRAGWPRGAFEQGTVRAIAGLAVPVALINLGTQVLLNIDLWFVGGAGAGAAAGGKAAGYYVAAKNLARIPNLVAFVMNAVLIPSIAHAAASGDNELSRRIARGGMRFLTLTLVPGCALIATLAAPLLALLFSPEYVAGAGYLQLLVMANGLLQTTCSTLITVLVASRHQRAGAAVALVSIVPALVLSAVLVPRFGALGGAIAGLASTGVATLLAGTVAYRQLGPFVDILVLLKVIPVTALVCLAASLLWQYGVPVIVVLVAAVLLFLALAFVAGLVSRADLQLFGARSGDGKPTTFSR